MAHVKEIRQSIDRRLDTWEKKALAFEAHIEAERATALDRIEVQKRRNSEALDRAKAVLARSADLAEEGKSKILTDLDHLKLQLALGKMETRQAYKEQRKHISDAVARFEASLDARVAADDRALDEAIEEWIAEESVLEAEIEAAEIQWALEQEERREEWESKKQAFSDQLQAFRRQLDEKQSAGREKLGEFSDQAGAGFEQIRQAFRGLVS